MVNKPNISHPRDICKISSLKIRTLMDKSTGLPKQGVLHGDRMVKSRGRAMHPCGSVAQWLVHGSLARATPDRIRAELICSKGIYEAVQSTGK